jgi:1,4-dihydroxy-2-naphthoate octaprenyltransferase
VARIENNATVNTAEIGSIKKWVLGARPRTLPAAIAPVVVGTTLIRAHGRGVDRHLHWINAVLALAVSLLLQIAVNYANDYSDGIRGTDEVRVGPIRLVASGVATARAVKSAALITFALAAACGAILAARTSWWIILVGALAIVAAWTYTGTAKPYGYMGFGEISVFTFFGVVATMGSYFAQSQALTARAFLVSLPMGALSCAILSINNLRDRPKDQLVGKRTLAVRLGDKRARLLFVGLILLAHVASILAVVITPWTLISLALIPGSVSVSRAVLMGASGRELIPLLGKTGRLQMLFALCLAIAFCA